jgi:sulfate/thiosulfate transport system ATP-binding protein
MSIDIDQVSKNFGQFRALDNVSLHIEQGELLALLGPSGCGKTTLLRIIAGLESADQGTVAFSGEDATHKHVRERQVGFVFQHYALFRHMTVFDNVAFGLQVKPRGVRPPPAQIRQRVTDLLKLVQLDWLADRYPAQLSGGQRQRIALARALAVEPKVLLLDEPFGALDAKVRKELRRWLRRLHDELHVTSIFVTHDQEEALEVADRVVLMNHGRIEQQGTPQAVWDQPASPFVYGFLGDVNRLDGVAHQGQWHWAGGVAVAAPHHAQSNQLPAQAYVRPHDVQVSVWHGGAIGVAAELERALVIGPLARLELRPRDAQGQPSASGLIEAQVSAAEFEALGLREGQTVAVGLRRAQVFADAAAH